MDGKRCLIFIEPFYSGFSGRRQFVNVSRESDHLSGVDVITLSISRRQITHSETRIARRWWRLQLRPVTRLTADVSRDGLSVDGSECASLECFECVHGTASDVFVFVFREKMRFLEVFAFLSDFGERNCYAIAWRGECEWLDWHMRSNGMIEFMRFEGHILRWKNDGYGDADAVSSWIEAFCPHSASLMASLAFWLECNESLGGETKTYQHQLKTKTRPPHPLHSNHFAATSVICRSQTNCIIYQKC